jgi:hypothetical protein
MIVAKKHPDVDVDDDRFSMVLDDRKDLITRLASNQNVTVTYFEGLNILVRIPGTSGATGTILLSAHIDSVSTAPGATVTSSMAKVDFRMMEWAQSRQWSWCVTLRNIVQRETSSSISTTAKKTSYGEQKRIAVPNHANLVLSIILGPAKSLHSSTLKALAPGKRVLDYVNCRGPALLFRTSNAAVARAYRGTPYPRVSQLGNDFFKSGLIRSETDYIVYENMNGGFTPGLDVAFFKPRAIYHTGLDDIRHASRGSLQHMLSTGLTTVTNLANNVGRKDFAYGGQPVYFDFLGGSFTEVKMGVMWIWNLILLLVCPWILGSAFYGRITVYGKVILKGFGVASSAVLGSFIIVLASMAIFSTTSPAVFPSKMELMLVGVCTSDACLGFCTSTYLYDTLFHHPAQLSPPTFDLEES